MKPLKSLVSFMLTVALLTACSVEPKPIPYGETNCAHCNMTVADNRFGAELVNDKGKAIYFDSSECLAAFVNEQPEQGNNAAYLMVTDYTNPNQIINAREAHFLQSRELPSPMGMFLTAYADAGAAQKMQQEHGGRLLNWEEVVLAVQKNEKPE
ncbi:nitrous oxide reductase accessory protein NosL [Pontibacter sp. BT310]|uniref:Nitrous oxide reductase accessory protein NosL n=1 Tax=Pontibacter populi TaxID=890055 RepID=A0ABS6XB06_9BACT|nr:MULTISPECIES: nitrous oxide reductase accessory protein NosL [Pontibacter]MBJ6118320.1 nitrous oxide reductase accessory protein NosL [Pontibacter sp. BT310]MBR0570747.1 nitrous oxide reductase accessory protein NosL [Microvirga sp. STS03]MBW3365173.1 nitrous oxide reductase accessory protein NosL [Pontibacter populi]